jgi:HSP20 family protein
MDEEHVDETQTEHVDETQAEHDEPETAADEEAPGDGRGRKSRSAWSEAFSDMQQVVEDVIEGVRQFPPVSARGPRLDLVRAGDRGYRAYVDLPGIQREEVDVNTVGDELVVSGQRRRPELPEGSEVLRAERSHGRFRRALRLPADVDVDAIRARLVDGVLEIALPRKGTVESRSVEIE